MAHTDFNSQTTTYTYDPMNRLVRKSFPDGSNVAFTYTPTGRRGTAADGRGMTTYRYDASDRLVGVTHPEGDVVGYAYDPGGHLRQVSTPGGTTSYARDALNRLVRTATAAGEARYGYDLANNAVETTAPNGVTTRRTFDARNRLTAVRHTVGATVLGSFVYQLAPTGHRLQVTEADGSVEGYAYDALNRLVSEVRTGARPRAIGYEFDAVSNRTRMVRDGTETRYTYDTDDRLLTAGAEGFTYDPNGNLLSRSVGGAATAYEWDAENRLVRATGPSGAPEFTYDADGNLVARQSGGTTTRFLVDTNNPTGFAQVAEERDATGGLEAQYTYGADRLALTRDGSPSFYLVDGLGTVRLLTDAGGAVTDAYEFDAYGNQTGATGTTLNPYRFVGERFDPAVGLYYLRARWMDPATGRFVSRDAFPGLEGDPLTLHRYAYAHADPVNNSDPSGLMTLEEQAAVKDIQDILLEAGSYARTFLNLLHKVETAVDVLQTLQALLSYFYGGGGWTVTQLAETLAFEIGEFNAEEAGRSIVRTLPTVVGAAAPQWGRYILRQGKIQAILIYLPSLTGAEGLKGGFPAPKIGKRQIPVHFEVGGPGTKRITGVGVALPGLGSKGLSLQQIFRMELSTSPSAPGALTVIVDRQFRYVVRRPPGSN